jgi:predicted transcriptional regulator
MEDFDNPIELIKSSLSSIEDKIDNLSRRKESPDGNSQLSSVASSLQTIANSIETDDARQQRQAEMERHITDGVNTRIGNVTDAIKSFNRGLGEKIDKLSNMQVIGYLADEDKTVMRDLNRTLSVTDAEGKVVQAQRIIQQTANEAVDRIKEQTKRSTDDISNTKKDIYGAVNEGIANINKTSYEAKDRVIEASRWLVFLFKKKWLWITIAIVLWIGSIVGAFVMMNNAYGKQKAAEQALKSANDVIENMPDYRYWLIYKSENPRTAATFQKEADSRYGDRVFKESINPKNFWE